MQIYPPLKKLDKIPLLPQNSPNIHRKEFPMRTNTVHLIYIALFAAVLCIFAPISVPLPANSISLSLATLAVYLTAYLLPPEDAITAVGIYLLLGAVGLPVFSGYLSGISRFTAPGGGYLIGYLFLAGIASCAVRRFSRPPAQFFGILLATLVMYLCGTFWFAKTTNTGFFTALPACALVFLPFDIGKILLACHLGRKLSAYLPQQK